MKSIVSFVFILFSIAPVQGQTVDTAWLNAVNRRVYTTDKTGDIAGAIKVLSEALDTAYMRYGAENEATVTILEHLGDSQRKIGDYKAAEQSIAAQLDICRKLYGNRDKRVAVALLRLGYARFTLGQAETVERLYAESRQILEDLDMRFSHEMTNVNSNLAAYYQWKGFYVKAEQLHLEALRIERATPDFNEINYAGLLNNTAVFYSMGQRSDDAIAYYDTTMEILGKYVPQNHPYFLSTLENKGRTLIDAGRYREAESTLKKALDLARASLEPEDAQLAQLIRGIALLYTKIGKYDEAIRLVEESLVLLKNQSGDATPAYLTGLLNLATLHQYSDHLAIADTLLHQVIQILEQNDRTQTTQYAQALTQLGENYQKAKRPDLSRPLLEKGARLGATTVGVDHPTYYAFFGQAVVRQDLLENQPDSAIRLLDVVRGPILTAYGERHERFIKLETQYGQAWQLKGDAGQSLLYFSAAFTALQDILAENFRFLSVAEREKFARTFEDYHSAFLAAAHAFPGDEHFLSFLYDLTLFQKELLASYDRQLLAGWHQNADSTYRRYVDVRQMIARQWTLPVDERLDLPDLETERTALEKTLAENSDIAPDPDAFHPVYWQQVQKKLQTGDAALEWLTLPPVREGSDAPCYAVLVLLPGNSAPELVLLPPTEQVDALFASKGTRGLRYATRTYASDVLCQTLWQPLESRLSGVKRIFYAPTGTLHLINFGAIPTSNGQILSEKYQLVRVSNTARLMDARFGAGITDVGAVLLAGGLDYEQAAKANPSENPGLASSGALWRGGGAVVREWAALPNTLPEVEHLAGLFKQKNVPVVLLTGPEGTESAVKAICSPAPAPGILHFATHGFFFEKNTADPGSLGLVTAESPMFRSGLILAGANSAWRGDAQAKESDALDDGILTADEISLLPLRNTKLVVLSACETGLGDVHDDEGVYGLQRAFRLAGAQNIVMSLWRVPDVQTREFMEKFYAALLENGDLRGAFQSARQAMKQEYDNPYYWAGFVLLE